MTHKMHRNLRNRRLSLEGLESRALLTSNVTVSVSDGVLHVQGDADHNDVQIQPVAQTYTGEWPGAKYLITGYSRYNGTTPTTQINGQESVIVEGVKNGAVIGLGHGNNSLRVSRPTSSGHVAAAVPGTVTVNTGSGFDLIRLYVQNFKAVTINSGTQDDRIDVVNSTLRNLNINSDPVPPPGGTIGGSDNILIGDTQVNGWTRVYTGLDNNSGGAGDRLRVQGSRAHFGGAVSIEGRAHLYAVIDSGTTDRIEIGGPLTVRATDLLVQRTDISGGMTVTQNNLVNYAGLTSVTIAGQLSITCLAGNDQVRLLETRAASTKLDGGLGPHDLYADEGGNDLGELTITGFEDFDTP